MSTITAANTLSISTQVLFLMPLLVLIPYLVWNLVLAK